MSRAKKIVAVLVAAATLNIGAGAAYAAPYRIDCSEVKPVQGVNAVALNCSSLSTAQLKKLESIDIRETRLSQTSTSRGFAVRPFFQRLREDIQNLVNRAAQKFGLSPALVSAVARVESGGNPNAVSPAGAIGVMQLMPGTAASLRVNPYDLEQNIFGGARYLRQQVDRFGSVPKALAAYNAGPGAVEKYGGIPPYRETKDFVTRVINLAGEEKN